MACVFAALLGLTLLWPAEAAAQRRTHGRAVRRAVPATRVVRTRHFYSRVYYSPYSWYWGWGGYPWYPYPYFYGPYGDPFWHGYGPWGYRYYDNYASVRVQASPRDAQVYVDGYFVGIVDDFDGVLQRLRVPAGGHEITLHLNGYRNAGEKMYLQPQSTYRFRARLEPLPAGAPQEPPPAPNPDAVRSRDYEGPGSEREPAEEPPGPPSRRWPARQQAEEHQAARESAFGTLAIRVQPADAEVLVDGTPWRGAADDEGALAIELPAGRHQIEIRREGFASFVTELDVRAGAATPLNVMLQKEN
jgi:hypothetical protein